MNQNQNAERMKRELKLEPEHSMKSVVATENKERSGIEGPIMNANDRDLSPHIAQVEIPEKSQLLVAFKKITGL